MLEAIALHLFESAAFHAFRHGFLRLRFLKCATIRRSEDMRIAFSALVLLRDGDHYLLVRNLHRPESFAPFGGVFKYKDLSMLDQFEFRPQTLGSIDNINSDMKDDLRGFLPRKNLSALVAWFRKGKGRETADDCLRRELAEEIQEIGISRQVKCPEVIPFRFIRRVEEGPENIPGETYTQYRIFEVYEPDISKPSVNKLVKTLMSRAYSGEKDLLFATSQEIVSGRAASGNLIGHHAGYLFGNKRVRPGSPMFKAKSTTN
jgi:SMODS-associated NUDIX domain